MSRTETRPRPVATATARPCPSRPLVWQLVALGVALAVNAALGPLLLDVVQYRYGTSMINQAIGLDAVALLVAAPLALAAAALCARAHPAGPVLAFAPATFAAYMMPQYVIGPDYLTLAGNNERAIPFHLATFVLSVAVALTAWQAVGSQQLPPGTARSDRHRVWVMIGLAAFTALGRWLPALPDALSATPRSTTYLDNPTAFWLVCLLDLGLVVPAAVAVAVGLHRGAAWSRKGCYAVIGWFSLVPVSVAAMAVAMHVNGDPLATTANTVTMCAAALVFTVGAVTLYRPLFGPGAAAGTR